MMVLVTRKSKEFRGNVSYGKYAEFCNEMFDILQARMLDIEYSGLILFVVRCGILSDHSFI